MDGEACGPGLHLGQDPNNGAFSLTGNSIREQGKPLQSLKLAGREHSSRFCQQVSLEFADWPGYGTTGPGKGRGANCGPWKYSAS